MSALRFAADLERKEEAAFPGTKSSTVDGSICPSALLNGPNIFGAGGWANEVIRKVIE